MSVTKEKPAPYAPASAIIDFIDRYRNRGLQSPFNAEVLTRAGISDSLIPRTLQALVALDLITDEGKATPILEGIRLAPEAELKKTLESWLKGAYAEVFSYVDPAKDDEGRIRDAFRGYNPPGQWLRMVSLFQGLCAAAGLVPEKQKQKQPQTHRASSSLRGTSRLTATARASQKPPVFGSGKSPGVPPAIAGVLESLPAANDGWTAAEREKFLKAFTAMLDFSFPIVEADEKEAAAD